MVLTNLLFLVIVFEWTGFIDFFRYKKRSEEALKTALAENRSKIQGYLHVHKELPLLFSGDFNFFDKNYREKITDLSTFRFNPITKEFDWLFEGDDGNLYSLGEKPTIGTKTIRIKDVRCFLTKKHSPFFTDYINW